MSEGEEGGMYPLDLTGSCIVPMVVKAVIELGVLEMLARDGPLSGVEIAAKLPTSNPAAAQMVDRMLRLLASCSVVHCSLRHAGSDRLYRLAPLSKLLLKRDDGLTFANVHLLIHDKVNMDSWYRLKDAVLEGGVPFEIAHGRSVYEYMKSDRRFADMFNHAMSDSSTVSMRKVVEMYEGLEGLRTVVDVGGGNGGLLQMIVAKYPSIKATNFDLPHVIHNAPLSPGVQHVSGDMFVTVPPGDAIIMKAVIHNWGDECCLKVLKNCYDAITNNGKLIVIESIVPEEVPHNNPVLKRVLGLDVAMLVTLPSGRERTANEYKALANSAGFKEFRVACNDFGFAIMEFLKY